MKFLHVPILLSLLVLSSSVSAQLDTETPIAEFTTSVEAKDSAQLSLEAQAWRGKIEAIIAARAAADEKLGAATEEDKAALQAEIDAHDADVDVHAERLQIVVNALDAQGEDVADYEIFLTEVTGKIDVSNLSTDMAVGLVGGWLEDGKNWIVDNGPGMAVNLLIFLLILWVFGFLGKVAGNVTGKALNASKLKPSTLLANFFVNVVRKIIFLVGLMIALPYLGFNVGPILAGIGVVGFVLGFALQDTLSNFAAGIMILLYRPYDVGDVVNAGGTTGKVDAMSLVSTTFLTPDNQRVVVPNGAIWGGTITNITANPTRRVDMVIGVGYSDDLDKAEKVLTDVVTAHPKVLKDPAPTIKCSNLGDSSVDFVVRPWCNTADYWDVHFDLTKSIKQRLDEEGLNIPFPQRDIHVFNQPA